MNKDMSRNEVEKRQRINPPEEVRRPASRREFNMHDQRLAFILNSFEGYD